MPPLTRRDFLRTAATAGATTLALGPSLRAAAAGPTSTENLRLASFRFDVTPPIGHSLCGGWIKPVSAVDDSLEAIGLVLLGAGAPIVLCAVDWTGLMNDAHLAWRSALASAAGTTVDRVTVHCVHQHNAPFVCPTANALVSQHTDLPRIFDPEFLQLCVERARNAVAAALSQTRRITHVATGSARIDGVASNRRIDRDPAGVIRKMRSSSCVDPLLIAQPEGLIDPLLRTVAFYDGEKKIAACHYYATHPMSYYGDGRVSSDFCGLARKQRQRDEPDCAHLYFTGCAGNIAAGKYNDGTPAARTRLTERMYRGIVDSEANLQRTPLTRLGWRTAEFRPKPNPLLDPAALAKLVGQHDETPANRIRPAFKLALIDRCAKGAPFQLSALYLDDTVLLHLPSEPFIEYQLHAQFLGRGRTVAVAGYGDGSPWYIPTRAEFPAGGYEVDYAFCAPETEDVLRAAIASLLT